MNDYKELIEILRDETFCDKLDYIEEAADAIEQFAKDIDVLTKERDKLKLDLCEANDVIEYANDRLKKAEKERDALHEYISGLDCSNCGMRGVQECV